MLFILKKLLKNINKIYYSKLFYNYFKYLIIFSLYSFNLYFFYKITYYKSLLKPKNQLNDLFRKINQYIINSIYGKQIIKYISLKPKITSLITLYNSEKTIETAVKSIQNQNIKDIEILLIDDNSFDKSLKIINNMKKNDIRIHLIKNKKNSGSLFSKSIGFLFSKGKYIVSLDSDDLFINRNIFSICYNQSETYNLDIIEFKGFEVKKRILRLNNKFPKIPLYLNFKENNMTLTQPKLFKFLYKVNRNRIVKLVDGYIWAKFIKKNIYIRTLKIVGIKIYRQYINYGDDRIINFVLFRISRSFKFIEEYGILYVYNSFSICHSYKKQFIAREELINLINIINFTKNSSFIKIVAFEFKKRWNSIFRQGLNEDNNKYINYLIFSLLNSKYLEKFDKKKLNTFLEELAY